MSAPWAMAFASFLFATMGVCVKLGAADFGAGEMVFYRGLIGALAMGALARRGGRTLRTPVPAMHFWRSLSGVTALCLWFYAIGGLPMATAMTLNYMSSVWMAVFLIAGAAIAGTTRVNPRLVVTVLLGFAGVGLILRPTIDQQQLWYGITGLLSGMIAATAYLQVSALGRVGEPDYRVVFYFSVCSVVAGAAITTASGWHRPTLGGAALLLAIGVLATAAQWLLTYAYLHGRTLVNASLQYLAIGYSFIYGVLVFDDPVTWPALAGMGFIVMAGLGATALRSRGSVAVAVPRTTPSS